MPTATYANKASDAELIQFLQGVGAPVNAVTLQWARNWNAQEGSTAHNNLFNTTLPSGGSTSINSANVQSYSTAQIGVQANINTILHTGGGKTYAALVQALRAGNTTAASQALVNSPWGTHTITDPASLKVFTPNGATAGGSNATPDTASGGSVGTEDARFHIPGTPWTIPSPGDVTGAVGGEIAGVEKDVLTFILRAAKIGLGVGLIILGAALVAKVEDKVAAANAELGGAGSTGGAGIPPIAEAAAV